MDTLQPRRQAEQIESHDVTLRALDFRDSCYRLCGWTPMAFIARDLAISMKRIEEPELERRFGEKYRDYRRRVPMFVPRVPGKR